MRNDRARQSSEMATVRMVRRGRMHELHPEFYSDDMEKSITANLIDVFARDMAELLAPLPALSCASGNMQTTADKQRAARKNKIGSYYWEKSRLAKENIKFADSMLSYGFGAYIAEADVEAGCPRARYESPFGAYYYKDRWGDVRWYAKYTYASVGELVNQYPQFESQIMVKGSEYGKPVLRELTDILEVVKYLDKDHHLVYLPQCKHLVLFHMKNPISRPCVVIAERPDTEDVPRGMFDDSVWPALGESVMAMYMLKAADQAVNAPWSMPNDVTEVSLGPDAVIRSERPDQIGRVALNIPNDVFAMTSKLEQAVQKGSRYPEARGGSPDANIITGRGVTALNGTLDTLIKTSQTVLSEALEDLTSILFELDEAVWPDTEKTIHGFVSGKPFEMTYKPSRDIAGNWHTKVTYGFAAGLSPQQAAVMLLQLRGDDQISRDTARRQLPFDLDPEEEQRQVDTQQLRDALKQGVSAWVQSIGATAAQGQNPLPVLEMMASLVSQIEKGKPIDAAMLEALPKPEEPAPEGMMQPGTEGIDSGGMPPEGELPPGMRENGLQEGVAYGQQGMAPGGMPAVQSLMARLRGSGNPIMEAGVSRKRPTGLG